MYHPTDNEFYLYRDTIGKKSLAGSIYLDTNHSAEQPGLHTVYGHHMKDGTMFRDIVKYLDPEYLAGHSLIKVFTAEICFYLEPIYCYAAKADGDYRRVVADREELQWFLYQKTGLEISSDNIYVFVTCSYKQEDERTYLICREKPTE